MGKELAPEGLSARWWWCALCKLSLWAQSRSFGDMFKIENVFRLVETDKSCVWVVMDMLEIGKEMLNVYIPQLKYFQLPSPC